MDVMKQLLVHLGWRLILYWGLLLGGLWLFIQLAEELYKKGGFFFDVPALTWFYGLLNPTLTRVAFTLSVIGAVNAMVVLSLLVMGLLWWLARTEVVFFLFSMGGASLVMLLTKLLFARERPALFPGVDLWQEGSPSFPSGHATGSFAFFLTLYLVMQRRATRWRWLAAVVGIVMVLGISASRLYLQVHYPSDILAGWALAAAWVLGVNYFYTHHRRDQSTQTVLLVLPKEIVQTYRAAAERQKLSQDEVVAQALRAQLEISTLSLTSVQHPINESGQRKR